MKTENKKSIEDTQDFFDEDFEVVYQEEDYSKLLQREFGNETDAYDDDISNGRRYNPNDAYDAPNYRRHHDYDDYSDYDDYDGGRRQNRRRAGNSRYNPSDLLSPAARTAMSGGKFVFRLANLLLRSATLILIALIIYTLAMNFWKNHGTYGNIIHALTEKNYILAAYAAVGACLILFECFAFLLVLATSRRKDRLGRKTDTGRGLFSFVLIYAGSYLSYFLNGQIPYSPAPLLGVQGALKIYGSLRFTLLPLCIAGIVSCLIRKFIVR